MIIKKDFLSIADLNPEEIWQVLILAKKLKQELKTNNRKVNFLEDKHMVMLFEKPSLRTKLSFDIGFKKAGGHTSYFGPQEVGLGVRESVPDVAKVISSQANLVVARVFSHKQLEEFVKHSTVPVINALSDLEHPCQALADFLTILEMKKKLKGLTLAFIGDGENNVPHSLVLGCTLLGINFNCASPKGYWMNSKIVNKANQLVNVSGVKILQTEDPKIAVKNADIVYTDTWISMGDEMEQNKRLEIFKKYQVNQELMKLAKQDAIFMHDMPAYRGTEVSAEVIDSPKSVVFQQAENRLYSQLALIIFLMRNQQNNFKNSHSTSFHNLSNFDLSQ